MSRRPDPIEIGPIRATTRDRTRPDGRWYWRARTKVGRRDVWSGWATRDEVAAELAHLLARGLPSPEPANPGDARTLADLLALWLDAQQRRQAAGQIAERTLHAYRYSAGYWVAALGDVRLAALTRARVSDTATRWQAEPMRVAARTVELAVRVLRIALAWAHDRGGPKPPELAGLVRVRSDEHRASVHTPTQAEAAAMVAALDGTERAAVELLALTGARVGEAVAAHVGDYDGSTLRLSGRDDERGRRGKVRPRLSPATGRLVELLDELVEGRPAGARLLALEGDAVGRIHRAMARACREAGVPHTTPHGLRRMVAMGLLDAGVDARTVSELTGHSVQVLLAHYVRPTPDRLREAVARLGAAPKVLELDRRRR